MIKGIWTPVYIPVKQEVMAGQFHVPSHPGMIKYANMNGNILLRYFFITAFFDHTKGMNNFEHNFI